MKKLIFILSFVCSVIGISNAQTKIYCEIVEMPSMFGRKEKISIDFGQEHKILDRKVYVDENGEALKFNSKIEALNFMISNGWEFVQAYVTMSGGGSNGNSHTNSVCHYLLCKIVSCPEELEKELRTRYSVDKYE